MAEVRTFLEEKLYALHLQTSPDLRVNGTAAHHLREHLRRDLKTDKATLRNHEGVMSLQYGRGRAYCFDLQQEGLENKYIQMVEQVTMGRLSSIDHLVGSTESYQNSGIEGNKAYLITITEPISYSKVFIVGSILESNDRSRRNV